MNVMILYFWLTMMLGANFFFCLSKNTEQILGQQGGTHRKSLA